MLIDLSKITHRFFADPLGLIENASICNADVFRDLIQCAEAQLIIFIFLTI